MVSKRSSKRGKGRPAGDPLDVRTQRFSFRLHPDLHGEVNKAARKLGLTHSLWFERAACEKIHRDLKDPGLLDAIGRYADPAKSKAAAEERERALEEGPVNFRRTHKTKPR